MEAALKGAAIWNEVKDRLDEVAGQPLGGSSSVCALRARWPGSGDHPVRRTHLGAGPDCHGRHRELIAEIKLKVTILIVTHNMQQAAALRDYVAYMYLGELMEFGATTEIIFKPKRKETEDYITGRFG